MQTTVVLNHERDTKGTHFYATKEELAIRSVYIQKGTFGEKAPKVIKLQIETED